MYQNSTAAVTTQVVLFKREVLRRLKAYLGFANKVRRDFQAGQQSAGDTVMVPNVIVSGGYRSRTIGGAAIADPVSAVNLPVKLGQIYKGVTLDNLEQTLSIVDLRESAADQIAQILIEGIDASIAAHWWKIPYEVGHQDGAGVYDGGAMFNPAENFNILAKGAKWLEDNRAPKLSPHHLVLNTTEAMNIRMLDRYQKVNEAGSSTGRTLGSMPELLGWQLDRSHSVPDVELTTAATWGAPLLFGAHAIGAPSITVDGLGAGEIAQGSVFKLGNYFYSVAADVVTVGGAATLPLVEKLKEALADNTALAPHKYAAGKLSMNLGFTPESIVLATREEKPFRQGTGVLEERVVDPETNLAFRLLFTSQVLGPAGEAFTESITASMLIGSEVVRPENAVRFAGQATQIF